MNPSKSTSRDTSLDAGQEDGTRALGAAEAKSATAEAPTGGASPADRAPRSTRASAAWAAIITALLLCVVLIVFVLQNPTTVVIHFLGWSGSVTVGMAMLIAAVTGGLLVAAVGVARLTQLRVRARRTRATPQ